MFALFTWYYKESDLLVFNFGYADKDRLDGLYLEGHSRNVMDRYRLQMYDYLLKRLGMIDSMRGKTVLETGCGRGGGLKYIAESMNPRHTIGIDNCQA